MKPTATEERACQFLIELVTSIVGKTLPNNPLELIGSRRTGLAVATSDIDFSLSIPEYEKNDPTVRGPSPMRPEARKDRLKKFFVLSHALRRSEQFMLVDVIHARIPIVTAMHRHTGLTVHIQGLHSTLAARTCVAGYLSEYPTLRSLYILLRSALDMRVLTTVLEGGLGSYTIFMMIVNALKHASLPSSSGYGITRHDLAAQLFWVLDFYATADLRKNGYSIDPPRVFPKAEEHVVRVDGNPDVTTRVRHELDTIFKYKPKQPYLLCLQDPADPTNDLGSKSHTIMHVQKTFKLASELLKRNVDYFDNLHPRPIKKGTNSILYPLVGANYKRFTYARNQMSKAAARREDWGPEALSRVAIMF